ncbi:hypothetical protein EV363DRAFT_1343931 [Boletus edulis]|nr:hypothetical protein EV363DRAFT_1343931 [Boletus edulis]
MAVVHTLAFGQVAPAAAGVIQFSPSSYLLRGVLPPALRPLRLTGPVPVPSNSESEFAPVVVFVPGRGIATLPGHTHFRLHHALSPTRLCASPMTSPLSRRLFGPARRGVVFALDGMHGAVSMWISVWLSCLLRLARRTRWVRNSTHCFPFRSWQMRNAPSHTQAIPSEDTTIQTYNIEREIFVI